MLKEEKARHRESDSKDEEEKRDGVERNRRPVRLWRAKTWSPKVEENYRLQAVGWKDIYEYEATYGDPDRWHSTGSIKCLRVKQTGYYTYWSDERECEDRYVGRVKMYDYE